MISPVVFVTPVVLVEVVNVVVDQNWTLNPDKTIVFIIIGEIIIGSSILIRELARSELVRSELDPDKRIG